MLNLICNIEIENKDCAKVLFDYCSQVEIKTSCRNLTDTAIVKVPQKISWKGKPLSDFINHGDKISIALGYKEYGLETLFNGYIKSIENNLQTEIACENEMWNFKKINVPAEKIDEFDLKDYIKKYGSGVKVDVADDLRFGSMDISEKMTLAKALDEIMKIYPYVLCYFDGNIFKAVLSTKRWAVQPQPIVFDPTRNIISSKLKYTIANEPKIGLKVLSVHQDNTPLVACVPKEAFTPSIDKDGKESYTIKKGWVERQERCPQCRTQEAVEAYAEQRLPELTTNKMEENFTAFGVPLVRKGDLAQLKDDDHVLMPKNKGGEHKKFVVDAVEYKFDKDGYRQVITLGYEIK